MLESLIGGGGGDFSIKGAGGNFLLLRGYLALILHWAEHMP